MTELVVVAFLVFGVALVVFAPVLGRRSVAAKAGAVATPSADERTSLREQKQRVLRNLRELEAERAAGRVSEAAYAALHARDQAEAARLIQQLEKLDADLKAGRRPSKKLAAQPAAAEAPAQRAARAAAWVGGIMAFLAVLAFTMSRAITERAPGGTITGTIPGSEIREGSASPMLPAADPARLAQLEQVIGRDSSNLAALLEAGHLYLGERRLDEAARVTMRAVQIDRESPEAYAHIAVLLFAESGSHTDPDSARTALGAALDAVNRAIELKPDLAEAWLFKGMISMGGLRDPNAAADAWEQYLKVAPRDADTSRIAAMVRGLKGR